MKLMISIVIFIIFAVVSDCVRAESRSTHMTHFKIQQSSFSGSSSASSTPTSGQVGFIAQGETGFVSHTQDTLAAASVKLEISQGAAVSHYDCASFTYNLKSGFVLCDNREVHKISLSIDSAFKIRTYAP